MWVFLALSVLLNLLLVAAAFSIVSAYQEMKSTNVYLRETLQMYLTEIVVEMDEEADGVVNATGVAWT